MTERDALIESLRSMPSSLNDACRRMDMAADFIEQRSFDRNTVIEECAKVAESWGQTAGGAIAKDIRALAQQEDGK